MNVFLEKYLYVDKDAYDSRGFARSVHGKDSLRYDKAVEEAEMNTVSVEVIIDIIKTFLMKTGITTADNPVVRNPSDIDYQEIKKKYNLDNKKDIAWLKFTTDGYVGVVATSDDINFDYPNSEEDYDKRYRVYNPYTKKTESKWVYNTSGILLHKLNKIWDESFVLVFPLSDIPVGYKRGNIEHAIGNLLIENDVPIIDYFSHLY